MLTLDIDKEVSTKEKQQTVDKYIPWMKERGFSQAEIWTDVAALEQEIGLDTDPYEDYVRELKKTPRLSLPKDELKALKEELATLQKQNGNRE